MFRSFFQAGFEGSTGYNRHGEWFDQVAATQHDLLLDEDYARLRQIGIRTVREAVRWPLLDRGGRYDFSSLGSLLEASKRHQIEIIYDLFHFGYPRDLDPFSRHFIERFADYCHAAADYICRRVDAIHYFTPVNEPSYLAWAAGEVGLFAPHQRGRGWELKVRLVEAAIAGINAIRAVDPRARMVNVDPICHVAAPRDKPEWQRAVDEFNNEVVFQSWDMLCGRLLPELGGSRAHLDIVGINYYWTNQWEWGRPGVALSRDDERCHALAELVGAVSRRYGAEMLISETAEVGDRRGAWVRELASEVEKILAERMPLRGVCLYPILSMPEWHARDEWTRMGLWDLVRKNGRLARVADEAMMSALRRAQRLEARAARIGR